MAERTLPCPLCDTPAHVIADLAPEYGHCPTCDLRFLNPNEHLAPAIERERYSEHQNNHDDLAFREFLRPLWQRVIDDLPPRSRGLDYGSGPTPVLAKILSDAGFQMEIYDPYFAPDRKPLGEKYDFVVSTEVVEHFYRPSEEFARLKDLLKTGGRLLVMTSIVLPETDFKNWYYRRDPTHVSFYSPQTMRWIAKHYGFKEVEVLPPRVAVFKS